MEDEIDLSLGLMEAEKLMWRREVLVLPHLILSRERSCYRRILGDHSMQGRWSEWIQLLTDWKGTKMAAIVGIISNEADNFEMTQ